MKIGRRVVDPTGLPDLSPTQVQQWARQFDEDLVAGGSDQALHLLFRRFPRNTDFAEVLLKTACLDRLYNTFILRPTEVAGHILNLRIDRGLEAGSYDVVEDITGFSPDGKPHRIYSFATKYCSWHKPTVYPIYDRLVDDVLWAYSKKHPFADFKRYELKEYLRFVDVVKAFAAAQGLASLDFKTLDKGLWWLAARELK